MSRPPEEPPALRCLACLLVAILGIILFIGQMLIFGFVFFCLFGW